MSWTPASSPWTPEEDAQLVKLWNDGLSASQVMKALGRCSRSAVIGRLYRLRQKGMDLRVRPPTVTTPRTTFPKSRTDNRAKTLPLLKIAGHGAVFERAEAAPPRVVVEPAAFAPIVDVEPVPFFRRSRLQCSWHVGREVGADMLCCGGEVPDDGGPEFCPAHREAARNKHAKPAKASELIRSLRRWAA